VTDFLRAHGMTWQAQCYPRTIDELKPIIEHVQALGADHINLQPDVRPYTLAECIPYIEGWTRLAQDAGIALHIETHRDRMTTDLSHYVVGREFAWPISAENHALIGRILDQSWGFHGRVASREQIQLQLDFAQHRQWVELFMGWWRTGFEGWRRRAPEDAVLTFLCELGPPEYAMTGADGYELSDRWSEAQALMQRVRALWKTTELDIDASLDKEQAPGNI
jgi:hypothetical protein